MLMILNPFHAKSAARNLGDDKCVNIENVLLISDDQFVISQDGQDVEVFISSDLAAAQIKSLAKNRNQACKANLVLKISKICWKFDTETPQSSISFSCRLLSTFDGMGGNGIEVGKEVDTK